MSPSIASKHYADPLCKVTLHSIAEIRWASWLPITPSDGLDRMRDDGDMSLRLHNSRYISLSFSRPRELKDGKLLIPCLALTMPPRATRGGMRSTRCVAQKWMNLGGVAGESIWLNGS